MYVSPSSEIIQKSFNFFANTGHFCPGTGRSGEALHEHEEVSQVICQQQHGSNSFESDRALNSR